ncbi:hypothetical protein [Exiguobacterium sp. s142]|uniref:hypothetical protein n=1 Tax=Exiguobacterium sp. s142 TaxID=2751222 RepID=UPI001BE9BDEA|nr:hypothetical protein [Exiguobacterium sp. s142]
MAYERSKKTTRQRKIRLVIVLAVLLVLATGAIYIWGYKPAEANAQIHVRFKEALLTEDVAFFEQTVEYETEPLTRAEALRFMRWLNEEKSIRGEAISEVAADRADERQGMESVGLFRLLDTGDGRFGFADYRIELLPQTFVATSDVPLTNIWVDGTQVGRIDAAGDSLTVERMPGRYDVKAVAVVNGETVTRTETVTLVREEQLAFALQPEANETIAGQFDIERVELIEIEVEARTGHSLETIESVMNKREKAVVEQLGEPLERDSDVWRYDGMDVTFVKKKVNQIDIDLDKRTDDMVALLGEPNERIETELGIEWRYDRSLFESIFTLLGLETDKRFIERDGAMYLLLS